MKTNLGKTVFPQVYFSMEKPYKNLKSLKFFRTSKNGPNSDYFAKNAHKIAKSKYFPDILNDSDSPKNSLSDDI